MKTNVVQVAWVDSRQPSPAWQLIDDITGRVCRCVTVGFLISRDEKQIVVAQSLGDEGGQAAGVMTIPAACVTSIKTIKRGR